MQGKCSTDIFGIDISNHQNTAGPIDWQKVKDSGVQFVYVKASEGSTYKDPYFVQNVKGAQTVGLPVGAYHFARPEGKNVQGDAQNFIAQLKQVNFDLIPVLDLEEPGSGIAIQELFDWKKQWIETVEREIGQEVLVYTAKWFLDRYEGLWNGFTHKKLWVAEYPGAILHPTDLSQIGNLAPKDFAGWTQWTMWQFASDGQIPGLSGNIDVNIAVSLDTLRVKREAPSQPAPEQIPQKPVENVFTNKPDGAIQYGNGFAGLGWYMKHSDGWRFWQADLGKK